MSTPSSCSTAPPYFITETEVFPPVDPCCKHCQGYPLPATSMASSAVYPGSAIDGVIYHGEQDIAEAREYHELETSSRPPPKNLDKDTNTAYPSLSGSYELSTLPTSAARSISRDDPLEAGMSLEGVTSRQTAGPGRASSSNVEERDGPSAKQSARYKWYARLHFAAICWCFFLQGWNDGTTGPLLPRMQSVYHVRCAFPIVLLPQKD